MNLTVFWDVGIHHVVGQVPDNVLRSIPPPSVWYSAQEMCVQLNVPGVRKCVASRSVESTRRHEPEYRTLHIQYRENLKLMQREYGCFRLSSHTDYVHVWVLVT